MTIKDLIGETISFQHAFTPVGVVRSPYGQRFGTPRQPHLNPKITCDLVFPNTLPPSFFQGLEQISHIWVLFVFHQSVNRGRAERSTVKPPRALGKRFGVFATRSPDRPNPIGLTLAKIEHLDLEGRTIRVRGGDWVDGTPILDIKPFHREADVPEGKVTDWWTGLEAEPEDWTVCWTEGLTVPKGLDVTEVEGALREDPRPLGQKNRSDKIYGFLFREWNVRFRFIDESRTIEIVEILNK